MRASSPSGLSADSIFTVQVNNIAEQAISVTRNGTGLADNAAATDFGTVNITESSATTTFVVTNSGAMPLTGLSVQLTGSGNPGDFVLNAAGFPTSLAGGVSASITVTFVPSAAGSRTAVVQIPSNDPNVNPFRLNLTGTGAIIPPGQDTDWGAGGVASIAITGYTLTVGDAAVAADGSVVVVGSAYKAGATPDTRLVVARLRPDGTLDPGFGTAGIGLYPFSSSFSGEAVALLANGKVLVAGRYSSYYAGVVRLTAAGVVDATFNTAGSGNMATYRVTYNSQLPVKSLTLLADGSALVLANADNGPHVLRCLGTGYFDSSFAGGYGITSMPYSSYARTPVGLEVQSGGGILVNAALPSSYPSLLQARYSSTGVLDTTYGAYAGFMYSARFLAGDITAVQTDATGITAIAQDSQFTPSHTSLIRMTGAGLADNTFALDGIVSVAAGTGSNVPVGMVRRGDGRLLVGGGYSSGFGVLRFRPDGTLDTDFAPEGLVTMNVGASATPAGMRSRPDGRVVVFGSAKGVSGVMDTFALAMFNPGPLLPVVAPVVTQSPASQTVEVGAAVVFTVGVDPANGLQPWYRWSKNGTVITTATTSNGPTLAIASAQLGDEGAYSVEVGNYAGSTVLSGFSLTLHAPPQIITAPVAYTGPRGVPHDFTVMVSGRQPLSYKWLKGAATVSQTALSALFTNTLTVLVDATNDGDYSVVITNADGSATTTPVAFQAQPSPPRNATISAVDGVINEVSGSPSIEVDVDGVWPITYQWQKNGKNYLAPQVLSAGQCLIYPDPVAASSGSYRCIITNADGTVTTNAVTFTIWPNPTVRQVSSTRQLLQVGSLLELDTNVYSITTPSKFQWQLNGHDIPGATSTSYNVQTAQLADGGSYRLQMGTLAGTATSDVASVAVVEIGGRSFVAAQGKPVNLTVNTVGDGLTFAWKRKDGMPLPAGGYSGAATATLTLTHPGQADAVLYACDVGRSGVPGTVVTAKDFQLVVESAVPVLGPHAFGAPAIGRSYTFTLTASHSPTSFAVTGLPTGLVCNAATGVISGVPKVSGSFKLQVTATNPVGTCPAVPVTLVVVPLEVGAVGTFAGPWFTSSSTTPQGTFTLTIAASGSYTGKVFYMSASGQLSTLPFTGEWTEDPYATYVHFSTSSPFVVPPGRASNVTLYWKPDTGIGGQLNFDPNLDPNSYPMTFYQNPWNARSNPATAFNGYYTAEIAQVTPIADSDGSGYATFTPGTGGTFTFAGKLPDGTAIAIPAFLNASGASWVFTWLYGNKGTFGGEMTLSVGTPPIYRDSAASANFLWVRPPQHHRGPGRCDEQLLHRLQQRHLDHRCALPCARHPAAHRPVHDGSQPRATHGQCRHRRGGQRRRFQYRHAQHAPGCQFHPVPGGQPAALHQPLLQCRHRPLQRCLQRVRV